MEVKVKISQSCPTLCDSMDYTIHGILQVRILECIAFPFSRGSSQNKDLTQVSHIADRFFTSWAIGEALTHGKAFYFIYFLFLFIYLILFFNFTILSWFCHISTWIHNRYTRVPHPKPSSLPYHPSGSSQCTSPKHPVSCIEPGLATHFIYDITHVSMPFSQIIPPSPSPTESKRLFYTSVSLLLSRIQGYCYHLSKIQQHVHVNSKLTIYPSSQSFHPVSISLSSKSVSLFLFFK